MAEVDSFEKGIRGRQTYHWLALLFFVYLGAMLFAALVVSPIWNWALSTDPEGWWVDMGFRRTFDRLRWVPVLLSLYWLLRVTDLLGWRKLGFIGGSAWREQGGTWILIGVVWIALAAVAQVAGLPSLEWRIQPERIPEMLAVMILSPLAIAFLEEVVFRGLILKIFLSSFARVTAIFLSAVFFAYTHFKKIPDDFWYPGDHYGIEDGLAMIPLTLMSIALTFDFIHFLSLFAAGIVLNLLRLRTGSLWPCIGLHAGWVFFLVPWDRYGGYPGPYGPNLITGNDRLINGLLPFAVIAIGSIILVFILSRQRKAERESS